MQNETMVMGNAVIGDLEMANMRLKDELELTEKRFQNERQYAQEQRSNAQSWMRMIDGDKSATDAMELIRNILNETDPQDDDENMRELRKIAWNASDTEKQLDAEESVPF